MCYVNGIYTRTMGKVIFEAGIFLLPWKAEELYAVLRCCLTLTTLVELIFISSLQH